MFKSHQVLTQLEQKSEYWLTARPMGKCQAILLDNPNVTLQTTTTLNPAALLLSVVIDSDLQHNCLEIIVQIYASQPNLLNQSWQTSTEICTLMEAVLWKMGKKEWGMLW